MDQDLTPNPDPCTMLLYSRVPGLEALPPDSFLKGLRREEMNLFSKEFQISVGVGGIDCIGPEGGGPLSRVALSPQPGRPGHRAYSFFPGPPHPGWAVAVRYLCKSGPSHPWRLQTRGEEFLLQEDQAAQALPRSCKSFKG